jgi:CRP-like cAMP-binding protein
MVAKPEPQQNHLLAALSPEVQGRLFPYLELVQLPLRAVLYESGRPMRHVYFPTDSIVSLQYVMENGASTAILVVGNEGLLGITLFMGGESTPSRSLVQSAGYAYRLPRSRVKEEFNRHGQLLVLMLRYTQALITQIAQTAVCNRHHAIDQQLCRWLLLSIDRLSHNHLTMTQEFIANMLGVRREGVTQAASKLQQQGVISYSRGMVKVIDRAKLETLSCECYSVVKKETEMLLPYLPQRQTITNVDAIPTATLPTQKKGTRQSVPM